jgi:hypothetical protein
MADSSLTSGSSSSKSLMWMMIAVSIGLSGLLGGGLFLANRMVRSMGLAAATNKGTIRTPGGSFRLERQGDIGPGLPVYPNAAMVLPTDKATAIAIEERKNGISTVTYQTRDTRDSVDLWYSKHLGPEFARHDAGEKPLPEVFLDARVSNSDIAFLAQRGRQVRIVALSLNARGTSISLLSLDKAPGQ